jgi:hypothetical protein
MPGNTPFHWDITADPAQFMSAMSSAVQSVQSSAGQIQSQLTTAFSRIQSVVVGLGAVIAGGSIFNASIEKSVALTKEAERLGRQFGISTTEAGALAIALGDIDQTSETLSDASKALVRTLGDDEQAVLDLGVATRDSHGSFRNQLDIMFDVNKRLLTSTRASTATSRARRSTRRAGRTSSRS